MAIARDQPPSPAAIIRTAKRANLKQLYASLDFSRFIDFVEKSTRYRNAQNVR
jgi:hypothetical protein